MVDGECDILVLMNLFTGSDRGTIYVYSGQRYALKICMLLKQVEHVLVLKPFTPRSDQL